MCVPQALTDLADELEDEDDVILRLKQQGSSGDMVVLLAPDGGEEGPDTGMQQAWADDSDVSGKAFEHSAYGYIGNEDEDMVDADCKATVVVSEQNVTETDLSENGGAFSLNLPS